MFLQYIIFIYELTSLFLILEHEYLSSWTIEDSHLLATIVHPQLKHFDKFPMYKQKAHKLLKAEIVKRSQVNQSSSSSFIAQQPLSSGPGAANIASSSTVVENISEKKGQNLLSSCFDKPRCSTGSMDEFTSWMSSTLTFNNNDSDDILQFWSKYEHLFPTIAGIARDVLAIPASNTCVQRVFSKSKATITDRRTSIGVAKLDRIVFLQKNFSIFKKIFDQQPYDGEQERVKRKVDQQENELVNVNSKKSKTNENDGIIDEEEVEEDIVI